MNLYVHLNHAGKKIPLGSGSTFLVACMVLWLVKGNVKKFNYFLPKVYVPDPGCPLKHIKIRLKKIQKFSFITKMIFFLKPKYIIKRSLPTSNQNQLF